MALSQDVKICRFGTPEQVADFTLINHKQGICKVWGGEIALTDSLGFVKSAATPTSADTCWGVISEQQDNTGGTSGGITVPIERGTFFFPSSTGSDQIAQSNIGQNCYVVSQTHVGLVSTSRPLAGRIMYIDATFGVAVKIGP